MNIKQIVLLVVVTSLVGCGTTTQRIRVDPAVAAAEAEKQRELYVWSQHRDQRKVQELAAPFLLANAELCDEDVRPYLGMTSANVDQWPKDYRNAAQSMLNVSDQMKVLHVIPNGPADLAGVKEGDVLVSVDQAAIPSGRKATEKTFKLFMKELEPNVATTFVIERDTEQIELSLTPSLACSYYVVLTGGDEVNAYADGTSVYITKGMLRFVETDTELATIIGHELAHNAMDHIDKKRGNYLLGSIFDIAAAAYGANTQGAFGNLGARAYSQAFEAEADYVGLYAMARAGYDISESPNLWRRMGSDAPGAIESTYGGSHPGTAERYIALDTAVEEILAKQRAGLPLNPEPKGGGQD
jgi:membrane-associated protease RseP (regulator of RpoE activity)